jgi:hypothetical protein
MTRKLLFSFFALVFGLTFIVSQEINAQTSSTETSPYIGTVSPSHGINSMWDVELSFDVTAASGGAGNAGAEFDGTYFYTTRWASNLIHKYDMAGNLVEAFSIPGVSGLRDLAFDGTYMYGGAASTTIYQMDFTTKTLVGTISSPVSVRFIAYDEVNDAFWCGNWADNPTLVSRSGANLGSFVTGLAGQYGAAYDNVSDSGPFLWIFDQGAGAGTPQIIYQFDIATGTATGVTHDVMTDVGAGNTSAIAGGLFTTSDFVSQTFSIGGLLQGTPDMFFVYELVPIGGTTITIAEAIEDLDGDFVPDRLGQTVNIEGVVFSPNYQTTNNSYYISDGTAGTDIFMYSPPLYAWDFGDMLQITGVVNQYNGMTEIIPADSTGWVFVSSGNPGPNPIVLTLAQYLANPELYEGSLVGFVSLSLVGGTWPANGSSANLQFSDGNDTVTFRIDSDTDIDGQPEPTWPQDILGIGSQYDSSPPYDGGYQIFPRYYATDFLPPGTLPVELTSFTAKASLNSVLMNWNTASEINNHGFEIQRNNGSGFITIGFVQGQGTSTQSHSYSYVDQNLPVGHYTYRLKQMDFQGSYSFSSEVSVDINPVSYSLEQNYPNPFNPSTIINFNLKVDSKVTLKVFNILGQEVVQLLNGAITAGNHQISFNASQLNSGVYLYRLEATGIDGSTFSAVKKMMLTK